MLVIIRNNAFLFGTLLIMEEDEIIEIWNIFLIMHGKAYSIV